MTLQLSDTHQSGPYAKRIEPDTEVLTGHLFDNEGEMIQDFDFVVEKSGSGISVVHCSIDQSEPYLREAIQIAVEERFKSRRMTINY